MVISNIPKGNASYINKINKINILRAIREQKEISRAELVKETGLSAPTVTRIVDSLIHEGQFVLEIGASDSGGGRPPIIVKFNGENNYVIGLDVGTTFIRGALANLNADIISETQIPTEVESGFDSVILKIAAIISGLIDTPGIDRNHILGIGMAVAGMINREKDIVEFSPDFNWKNVDIKTHLQEKFNIPIIYDNVTRVMALGELWYGIGKDIKNFICINAGYGIGASFISNGKPFYGSEGMAGEFGHLTLDKDSDALCKCGNTGCLEAISSGRGIAMAAQKFIAKGEESILKEMCHGDSSTITAEMVFRAAQENDSVSLRVISRSLEYLGIGIAGLINLLNPQAVVIGGGLTQAGDIFFDQLREVINQRVMPRHVNSYQLYPVTYGNNATVMGAVSLILNDVLHFGLTSTK